jgi:bacterioferritin-associated ferredoxin
VSHAEDSIIVCRCEDVTLGEIRKAIREGAVTLDEVKRITRAGMGPCQGRTCRLLVAGEIARFCGKHVSGILQSKYRPPVKPVKMGDLAALELTPLSESGHGQQSGASPECTCGKAVNGR